MSNLYTCLKGNRYWIKRDYTLHRENGPAVEYPNGDKIWFVNGFLKNREITNYHRIQHDVLAKMFMPYKTTQHCLLFNNDKTEVGIGLVRETAHA